MRMRDLNIEKITLNIGCGTKMSIDHAKKILDMISKRNSVITRTRKRTTFNVPKNKEIGCKVTIRKECEEFLKRMLDARENRLSKNNFDEVGNFSFGIKEYIDVQGAEYDPKIGVLGFDVCVTMQRPGYRVKRKRLSSKLGKKHVITKDESIDFVKEKFGVNITE
jgi:large subunit ribosomal protein L5